MKKPPKIICFDLNDTIINEIKSTCTVNMESLAEQDIPLLEKSVLEKERKGKIPYTGRSVIFYHFFLAIAKKIIGE